MQVFPNYLEICAIQVYIYNVGSNNKEYAMEITDVRVRKVTGEGRLKAYVSVTFDDCFVIHSLKIVESAGAIFIAMPSRRTETGEYRDIVHPIQADFRAKLQNKILEKFNSGTDGRSIKI